MSDASLLLDSHVWVWTVNGDAELGRKAKAVIRERARRGAVAVSGISFWELAIRADSGGIELLPDARTWLAAASRVAGLGVIDVDRDLMLLATSLEWEHGNPADRMLVATAMFHRLDLVTADPAILDFARSKRVVSVIDAKR